MRTIQLRRYTVPVERFAEFVDWWVDIMPSVRRDAGFKVEFALADRERGELTWAVSADGDETTFKALDDTYVASRARALAVADAPVPLESVELGFVENVLQPLGSPETDQ